MNKQSRLLAAILLLVTTASLAQTVEYIHTDALGSPVAITNSSGVVIERTVYEPYGAVINRPLNNRPGYTGHVEDAVTGLNYMQQRYYDPQLGRFLSNDPVTATSVGGNFNRYWYANNNPYRFTDPDGRDVVFAVDPAGAGGNGHTTLYFQDQKGNWYAYNQGAVGEAGSSGNLGFLSGRDAKAGVSIELISAEDVPKDGLHVETSAKQDGLIAESAIKSADAHNSGAVEYNLYSNNCTDAAVDVVNNSGAGIKVSNPATTVKPNSWIEKIKTDANAVKREEPKE